MPIVPMNEKHLRLISIIELDTIVYIVIIIVLKMSKHVILNQYVEER